MSLGQAALRQGQAALFRDNRPVKLLCGAYNGFPSISAFWRIWGLSRIFWSYRRSCTRMARHGLPSSGARDMGDNNDRLLIAILLYPGVTALDAVGPWEVFSRIPDAEIRFVGKEVGPVVTEGGTLLMGVTHTVGETMSPDLVLVPGGATTPGQMVDDEVLDWLRRVHQTTTWTASVCTGALILGAAGILKGQP